MLVTLSGIVTLVSPLQSSNAKSLILVTLFGIVTLVSPLQPSNAEDPMLVTLSGIVTLVSPLQPENAPSPILVTLSGIVTLVSPLQPENASAPMLVTLAGIVTSPFTPNISVLLSLDNRRPFEDEYLTLSLPITNDVNPLQPLNAEDPMLVTLAGIVTLVSPLQP